MKINPKHLFVLLLSILIKDFLVIQTVVKNDSAE
jgi:hypothetical protein